MQILIAVIINIIILAAAMPLFYIYIVSRARERFEKETMSRAREEIEALVKEFNNIALSRISILEDAIVRANRLVKELDNFKSVNNESKQKEEIKLDISINDIKKPKAESDENKKLNIIIEDNNINASAKSANDAKKEVIEKLRSRLDKTINTNIGIHNNSGAELTDNASNDSQKNEDIINLYKEGISKEEIAKKLNCSITEIDIVIDLEL
ncbi:hypothetical protein [uncultured Brachyspira sp.]|uniref:DUF6115 domain-containing protein n=1 Tax=uncultured Brachyspira sp. TaxID=221953 RepID=UPI002600E709|nr:hypothetical protein [uncultured Brachyspira sp.]